MKNAKELRRRMKWMRRFKSRGFGGVFLLKDKSHRIFRNVEALLQKYPNIHDLLVYYPIDYELPLLSLYGRLIGAYRLFFPVTGESELSFYQVKSLDENSFIQGKMGIFEPKDRSNSRFQPSAAAAIVPGLVFSKKNKGRVGYGGGYYDRFLAEYPELLKIGACYEFQLIENMKGEWKGSILPQHQGDISMDRIATENGIYFGNDPRFSESYWMRRYE
ncbi:MAG: 5-formyltetrahydrofolate cyclo-ligase [Lachnospiraceae bacterium]|nr:5-formyltetrahydrofolate cyclo-ligase [Lachnospiraceae bacterium]